MEFVRSVNAIFWGWLVSILLLGTGAFLTVYYDFPFFRFFKKTFKSIKLQYKGEKGGISSFAAMCAGLGNQVGTGNIAGVATAITSGGPGAIFWMWVSGLVGMATIFSEAVLAQIFNEKRPDGTAYGGPAYYIEKGLNAPWLASIFAIGFCFASGAGFNMLQANSIVAGFKGVSDNVNPLLIGIVLAIIIAGVITGGLKRIAAFATVVVPFMSIAYMVVALVVILMNMDMIVGVFAIIFKSAFGARQVAGGLLGFGVKEAFRFGVARGLLSNEAGQGSAPGFHASASVSHPVKQGFYAMFSIVTDTFLICTCTACMILVGGEIVLGSGVTGIELTQFALQTQLGSFGPTFIFLSILFFAFTSGIGAIYGGEVNMRWLVKGRVENENSVINLYRAAAIILVVVGAVLSPQAMFDVVDFLNVIAVSSNVIALLLLRKVVKKAIGDYNSQIREGITEPVWDLNRNIVSES